MNDTDEENDNADIEEEDGVEYIKRITEEAIDQIDENNENPMLDQKMNDMEDWRRGLHRYQKNDGS